MLGQLSPLGPSLESPETLIQAEPSHSMINFISKGSAKDPPPAEALPLSLLEYDRQEGPAAGSLAPLSRTVSTTAVTPVRSHQGGGSATIHSPGR